MMSMLQKNNAQLFCVGNPPPNKNNTTANVEKKSAFIIENW